MNYRTSIEKRDGVIISEGQILPDFYQVFCEAGELILWSEIKSPELPSFLKWDCQNKTQEEAQCLI